MLLTNNTSITAKRWLKILLDENDSLCTLSRPRWSWWLPSPRSWSSRIVPTRPETFPFLDLKSPERLFGHILAVLSGRSGRDPGAKAVKPFCLKLFHASQPCKDFPAFLSRIFALFAGTSLISPGWLWGLPTFSQRWFYCGREGLEGWFPLEMSLLYNFDYALKATILILM